jgi:transposase
MRRKRIQKLRRSWLEMRRRQAVQLLRLGWKQVEIAKALGVSKGAVSQWSRVLQRQGLRGLRAINRPGAPRKLDSEQIELIPELLWHGAEAYGFLGELWTCRRIASVIKKEFGVSYHPHHVAKIMKELKWTPHLPVARAAQRNEKEIDSWREDMWPELKKSAEREKEPISAG